MGLLKAFTVALLVGSAGVLAGFLPLVQEWEEGLGLGFLYTMRGPREAPEEVVVVSIDRATAKNLGVPTDVDEWPRSLHARLLERIAAGGAAVVAFDIIFSEPRPDSEDKAFAEAIRKTRSVILCQSITKEKVPLGGEGGAPAGFAHVEILEPICPTLADSATATAPFPLPKVPVRLNQFWKFKTGAGEIPTLPVVAFQIYALDVYDDFRRLLAAVSARNAALMPPDRETLLASRAIKEFILSLRSFVKGNPALAEAMLEELESSSFRPQDRDRKRLLAAQIRMYQGEDSAYLNYFGPPGSVTTIRYEDLLAEAGGEELPSLKGKAVFVGMSELLRAEQIDAFYTVFSRPDGVDLSGVEIAATAFANLLEGDAVSQPSPPLRLLSIFLWGSALGAACFLLSPLGGIAAVLGLGSLYLFAAGHQFAAAGTWNALVVPLLFQLPLATLGTLGWKYHVTNRERKIIRKAFAHYLPESEIDQLVDNLGDLSGARIVYSTLLFTDVKGYTGISEKLDPGELLILMNRYYQALFHEVKARGGSVSNIIGDAMLAFWTTASTDASQRDLACSAALDVDLAVERFNASLRADGGPDTLDGTRASVQLPTRLGLHSGYISLGNVGAEDHYELTPMGDIVNTASRLDDLNKKLGTRIIVSAEVIAGLEGYLARELGSFQVAGKTQDVAVYELLCRRDEATEEILELERAFADGLAAYRQKSWSEAIAGFRRCLDMREGDGPSRFFLGRCEQYRKSPPGDDWHGTVHLPDK